MIGKTLVSLGTWFNKHFPEKISTEEVYEKIAALELRLHEVTVFQSQMDGLLRSHTALATQVNDLAKRIEALTSENTALKAQAAMRMRIGSTIPMPGR